MNAIRADFFGRGTVGCKRTASRLPNAILKHIVGVTVKNFSCGCLAVFAVGFLILAAIGAFVKLGEEQEKLDFQIANREAVRQRLNSIESWFEENGLNIEQAPTERVSKADAFFLDLQSFKKYKSVLNGDSSFDPKTDIRLNPFDTVLKTLMDPELVKDEEFDHEELVRYAEEVLESKYVVLYAIEMGLPTKEGSGEFNGGFAVFFFTLVEIDGFKELGTFEGQVENSDEIDYYSSITTAATTDLLYNLRKEVDKKLDELFWTKSSASE